MKHWCFYTYNIIIYIFNEYIVDCSLVLIECLLICIHHNYVITIIFCQTRVASSFFLVNLYHINLSIINFLLLDNIIYRGYTRFRRIWLKFFYIHRNGKIDRFYRFRKCNNFFFFFRVNLYYLILYHVNFSRLKNILFLINNNVYLLQSIAYLRKIPSRSSQIWINYWNFSYTLTKFNV